MGHNFVKGVGGGGDRAPKIPSNFSFQKYIKTLIKYLKLVAKIFWDP